MSPRLRDDSLDETNFNWLLEPANEALSSASNFKNFYRGIFLEATSSNGTDGVLFGLDLIKLKLKFFTNMMTRQIGQVELKGL